MHCQGPWGQGPFSDLLSPGVSQKKEGVGMRAGARTKMMSLRQFQERNPCGMTGKMFVCRTIVQTSSCAELNAEGGDGAAFRGAKA